jgi:hypothetical protein
MRSARNSWREKCQEPRLERAAGPRGPDRFFNDYILTVQPRGLFVLEVMTRAGDPLEQSVHQVGRKGACQLYFTDYTLTGQRELVPSLGSDTIRRFCKRDLSNAFVQHGAWQIFFTDRTLSRSQSSWPLTPEAAKRLPVVPDSALANFFAYNNLTGRKSLFSSDIGSCQALQFVRGVSVAKFISPITLCLGARTLGP